jgi:signal transduction histidine kinase
MGMETASIHLQRGRGACRARIRGGIDEARLNAVLAQVVPGQTLTLDLREAHLSPDAWALLTRLARETHQIRVEPEELMALLSPGPGVPRAEIDMAAVLAHELRTPLSLTYTRLQGLAEKLAAEGHDAEAAICRRSYQDLMTATRLFEVYLAAAQPWTPVPVDLAALAAATLQTLSDSPDVQGVQFEMDVAGQPVVNGQPRALRQLIYNLALNAAQACHPGGRVRIRLRRDGGDAVLTVEDDGPGFPEAILREPFKPYRTGRKEGLGLGLAICKWLVDRHGGEIRLGNTPEGATVTVLLPLGESGRTAAPSPPAGATLVT